MKRSCLALLLAAFAPVHAQVSYTSVRGTSAIEGQGLEWDALVRAHGVLAERAGSRAELADATEAVARILERNRSFRGLSERESALLIRNHNRLVEALGVGQRLRCEKLTAVASKVRQTLCFLTD